MNSNNNAVGGLSAYYNHHSSRSYDHDSSTIQDHVIGLPLRLGAARIHDMESEVAMKQSTNTSLSWFAEFAFSKYPSSLRTFDGRCRCIEICLTCNTKSTGLSANRCIHDDRSYICLVCLARVTGWFRLGDSSYA